MKKELLTQQKEIDKFQGSLTIAKEVGVREAFIFEKLRFAKQNFDNSKNANSELFYIPKEYLMGIFGINISQLNFSLRKLVTFGYLETIVRVDEKLGKRKTLFKILVSPQRKPYINAVRSIANTYGIEASILLSAIESKGSKWNNEKQFYEFMLSIRELMDLTSLSRKSIMKAIDLLKGDTEGEEVVRMTDRRNSLNPSYRYFRVNNHKLRDLLEVDIYNKLDKAMYKIYKLEEEMRNVLGRENLELD